MENIELLKVNPKYVKQDILQVIDLANLPTPENIEIKDKSIVHMLPGAIGGNHRHPRIEFFIGFGDVEFFYLHDEEVKSIKFGSKLDKVNLLVVPSMVPHAVKNTGDSFAILYELADMEQRDVERIELI